MCSPVVSPCSGKPCVRTAKCCLHSLMDWAPLACSYPPCPTHPVTIHIFKLPAFWPVPPLPCIVQLSVIVLALSAASVVTDFVSTLLTPQETAPFLRVLGSYPMDTELGSMSSDDPAMMQNMSRYN